MVDPLGLVYEGKAGTGAAAGTPESPITGMLAEQIKQKRKEEKLKKSAAVGAFKPLGTPWDRDEVDIATKREELGKMAGKYMETNPKFIYQPQSPEYQGFMGAYNELKEDIAFSKQHAAVYKDLMDKAQSSTGLKHFDFDKTTNEYLAWAERPLAERKLLPLPMPTLKEETFDPNAFVGNQMSLLQKYPNKRLKTKDVAGGKETINETYIPERDVRNTAILGSRDPGFTKWGDRYYESATDQQKADLTALTEENGFENVNEYLYYERAKQHKYYQEKGNFKFTPASFIKNQREEDAVETLLFQIGRLRQGDAELYSKIPDSQGWLTYNGTDFTNIPVGTYIDKAGNKKSIIQSALKYKNGDFARITNVSEEKAEKSGNIDDKYELIASTSRGIDATVAKLIIPTAESLKEIRSDQTISSIKKRGWWKGDPRKQKPAWDIIMPKDEIETHDQRENIRQIEENREVSIKSIVDIAGEIGQYEYGWRTTISEGDIQKAKDINDLLKDLVISVTTTLGTKKYKSPKLTWTRGIAGGDLQLRDSGASESDIRSGKDVIKTIKSKEELLGYLENAVGVGEEGSIVDKRFE